ncbi:M20/M25/M40 family metallo-hydrolase [Pseudomonas syringae]|uniref:M20/M25/M40 family metallo-hydrolase n=1 Tax=Pseudomonas syringae TaxID=317 RepID=UPI0004283D17|nr:M20/M25/M40 family metallo-hydrolase [Pseudomonas syringae]
MLSSQPTIRPFGRFCRICPDYLEGFGVSCELIYNAQRTKANLFATIGPADVPGFVLSGHTDVVPVDGQAWTFPPFALSEAEGKLYGRGTLLPAMQAISAQSDIGFTALSSYPGLDISMHSQAADLIARFSGSSAFGTVAFGTEGGLFDQSGIPAVVCGPGSMEQGRKPDEFIRIEQLEACDAMLQRVLEFVSRP